MQSLPVPSAQAYLLMYSPVRTFPQDLHLKQPRCHCLSSASSACPFLMSLPQPAQSGRKQQPTVTAIPLAKSKESNLSSRRAARSPSHYVLKFCFVSLHKIFSSKSPRTCPHVARQLLKPYWTSSDGCPSPLSSSGVGYPLGSCWPRGHLIIVSWLGHRESTPRLSFN